jgi:hypothetical protein
MNSWPEGWRAPIDGEGDLFERQLLTEAGAGYALGGTGARLIARRVDRDDALYRLTDGRIAEVHLTWRGTAESDPYWPQTEIFADLEAWRLDALTN